MELANEEALAQGAASQQHTQSSQSSSVVADSSISAPETSPPQANPRSETNSCQEDTRPTSLSSIVPPYWRHYRGASRASVSSLEGPRSNPITLEDHTGDPTCETNRGLWASGVKIDNYVVVEGKSGVGSYVVWNCKIDTLDVCAEAGVETLLHLLHSR